MEGLDTGPSTSLQFPLTKCECVYWPMCFLALTINVIITVEEIIKSISLPHHRA